MAVIHRKKTGNKKDSIQVSTIQVPVVDSSKYETQQIVEKAKVAGNTAETDAISQVVAEQNRIVEARKAGIDTKQRSRRMVNLGNSQIDSEGNMVPQQANYNQICRACGRPTFNGISCSTCDYPKKADI